MEKQLKWFGCVERISPERLTKQINDPKRTGKRRVVDAKEKQG